MWRIYNATHKNTKQKAILVSDKTDREVRVEYKDWNYDQIDVVRDPANLNVAVTKNKTKLNIPTVIGYAVKVKKVVIFKRRTRQRMSKAAKKRKWSPEVKAKISKSRKGRGNHRIRHNWEGKLMISEGMKGNQNAKGMLWCYDPVTLKQYRVKEIPYNMCAGRPPASMLI